MSESDATKPLMNALRQDSFLPEDYVKSKGEKRANMLSLTLFGVMMLAVVAAFFATNRKWMSVRNEQRSINAMYVREAEKIEGLKELEMQRAEMITKAEVTAALVERVPRSVLFAELVRRMPEDLTLTELELISSEVKVARGSSRSSGVRTLSGSGASKDKAKAKDKKDESESTIFIPQVTQTLRIVGVGLENDDIATYIENLRESELLESVELKFIKESKIEGVVLRSFELAAQIRKGADARGLVKPVEPLTIPDIPSPDRLIPQAPIFLPPSVPTEKAEDGAPEANAVGVMKNLSMPGLYEAPVFGPSQSKWSSPSGLMDLMAGAARTAELHRSEKTAEEAQSAPSVEDFPVDAVPAPPEEPAPAAEGAPKPMWFTPPATQSNDDSDTTEGNGPAEGTEPAPTEGDDQEGE